MLARYLATCTCRVLRDTVLPRTCNYYSSVVCTQLYVYDFLVVIYVSLYVKGPAVASEYLNVVCSFLVVPARVVPNLFACCCFYLFFYGGSVPFKNIYLL